LFLPALGVATAIVLFQAYAWCTMAVPWFRVLTLSVVGPFLAGVPFGLVALGWMSASWLWLWMLAYLLLGGAAATFHVARDRRGESWSPGSRWVERLRSRARSHTRRKPFRSSVRAQFWYEWRCHGLLLPLFVLGILVVMSVPALVTDLGGARAVLNLVGGFILLPLLIAGTQGASLARLGPIWEKSESAAAFLGMRPVKTGDLVAAKFCMVLASVGLTLLITVAGAFLLLLSSGHWHEVWRRLGGLSEGVPPWRLGLIVLLGALIHVTLAFRLMTDLVPAGLAGRKWVEEASTVALSLIMAGVLLGGAWLQTRPDLARELGGAAPGAIAVALVVKLLIAGVALRGALRRGLLSRRELLRIVGGWFVWCGSVALALHAALPETRLLAPGWLLAAGVALLVPLGRFGLAPLALDWNRHR
jgi:hypothetical protein